MIKEAYELGVLAALEEAGLVKTSAKIPKKGIPQILSMIERPGSYISPEKLKALIELGEKSVPRYLPGKTSLGRKAFAPGSISPKMLKALREIKHG